MSELEQKEVHLNVLRGKADVQLKNKHPASDKIQVNICLSLSVCWFCVMFYCCVTHSENWCVCVFKGVHGDVTDAVELAAADHQMYSSSSEGKHTVQSGNSDPHHPSEAGDESVVMKNVNSFTQMIYPKKRHSHSFQWQ